jgi:hypothetical protein
MDERAFQIRGRLLCNSGLKSPAARQPRMMFIHRAFFLEPVQESAEELFKQALEIEEKQPEKKQGLIARAASTKVF